MATPSKAVHFKSPAEVLNAYDKQEVPAFALFCTKQLICKYQGDDQDTGHQTLQFWVDNLFRQQSAAIYTVCFFESVPKDGIKDNSPYDCSFNFRFCDSPMGYLQPELYGMVGGGQQALLNELQALRLEVKTMKEQLDAEPEETEQPEKKTVGEMLLSGVEPFIPLLAEKIIGAVFPQKPQVSRISGIYDNTVSPMEQLKVNDAVDKLRKGVPDIAAVLEKLALFYEKTPNLFLVYIKNFREMKI